VHAESSWKTVGVRSNQKVSVQVERLMQVVERVPAGRWRLIEQRV